MTPTLLLDVVGLTPRALAHMPRLRPSRRRARQARLGTVLPAVTCSVQSTMLTGLTPAQHGIVGNGWYFRDAGRGAPVAPAQPPRAGREGVGDGAAREARLHRREHRLVVRDGREHRHHRDPATDLPRRRPQVARRLRAPARPARRADRRARRVPAVPVLGADRLDRVEPRGSSRRPARSCASSVPTSSMAYLPHLDYDLQRFGPESPAADRAAAELDATLAPLLDDAAAAGVTVIAVAEYGIERGEPAGRRQPRPAPRRPARGLHPGRPRAARPVDVAGVRGRRPPGGARVRRRPRRPDAARASCSRRCPASTRCSTARQQAALRHRPRAFGRARRRRRAGRVVHLLLLARRRPGARVRPRRRHPPQARLRPRRAVLRPGRPAGEGEGGPRPA